VTGLDIDRGAATQMARKYRNAAEDLESALGSIPTAIDGGIASGVLTDIVLGLAEDAGDTAALSRVIGGVIDATVADASTTDDAVAASFSAVALPGDGDGS
jgi:hypothetical protein